jgi:hypothetical protein
LFRSPQLFQNGGLSVLSSVEETETTVMLFVVKDSLVKEV